MRKELTFRTFDELLADLNVDLRIYDEEGMIEPAQLIKVAQRVNYELGLKIHQTKETIIDLNHGAAKLPEDFDSLNFALLLGTYKAIDSQGHYGGRVTENVSVSGSCDCLLSTSNTCTPEEDPWFQRKCYSMCGSDNSVKVLEHCSPTEVREYTFAERLSIVTPKYLSPDSICPTKGYARQAQIKNGYLYCDKDHGRIYLSYQGALVSDEGDLLVMDHPIVNFFYITALTEYVFKMLYYSGEDMREKYALAKQDYMEARVRALSIVNTPDFAEMYTMWKINRKAQYAKYYDAFRTNVFQSTNLYRK